MRWPLCCELEGTDEMELRIMVLRLVLQLCQLAIVGEEEDEGKKLLMLKWWAQG